MEGSARSAIRVRAWVAARLGLGIGIAQGMGSTAGQRTFHGVVGWHVGPFVRSPVNLSRDGCSGQRGQWVGVGAVVRGGSG